MSITKFLLTVFTLASTLVAILYYAIRAFIRYYLFDYTSLHSIFKKKIVRQRNIIPNKERDLILRNGFSENKIPKDLDAIVIGSGIGGLGTASLLSQAGKKVLVLEQHDRAGGSTQIFDREGFEFDVGLHYVGEMDAEVGMIIDQITEGKVDWVPLADPYDNIEIFESEDEIRKYPIRKTKINDLYELFPEEKEAIDKFLEICDNIRAAKIKISIMRAMPEWIKKLMVKVDLHLKTGFFEFSCQSYMEMIEKLTKNKELQIILGYTFADFGTFPTKASIIMTQALHDHYLHGAYYPVGGSAQISANIINNLEKRGSKVLVRADVTRIVLDESGKTAIGVEVTKANKKIIIKAPIVISSVGAYNTYAHLLSDTVYSSLTPSSLLSNAISFCTIFIGYNKSDNELGVSPTQSFYFHKNDLREMEKWYDLSYEDAIRSRIPVLFISFPSSKDPTWKNRYPNKTTCEVVLPIPYRWFEKWNTANRPRYRGEEYNNIKEVIYKIAYEQMLEIYPQLRDEEVAYHEVGTPLTNESFLRAHNGVIYGLDHNTDRFSPENALFLDAKTQIKNLYLAGQDIYSAGVGGAAFSAFMCVSEIYREPVILDLIILKSLGK